MREINENEFKEEITNDNLSMVLFTARWCGSCRAVTPIIEQLSPEYNNVNFLKVDVDQNSSLASDYGITSIPTLLFLKDNAVLEKHVGALPKTSLKKKIDSHL